MSAALSSPEPGTLECAERSLHFLSWLRPLSWRLPGLRRPLTLLALCLAAPAWSFDPAAMETVFVAAPANESEAPVSETHHSIEAARLDRLEPASVAQVLRRLPSAHLPTNSRGETLVYLRGAGERQVGVFFDGALLNVPWDNRADLSLLPAAVVGSVVTASGTLSPQYGVNSLGAVALFARDQLADDANGHLDLRLGTEESRSTEVGVSGQRNSMRWLALGRVAASDGIRLSGDANLPFRQTSSSLRTNTDQRSRTGLARARWALEDGSIAATLLLNDGERGIAPESDRASGSRFWRYPQQQLGMAIVSADQRLGSSQDLTGSVWLQSAEQVIDAYPDDRYGQPASRELSEDDTVGLRAIHRWIGDRVLLSSSVNLLSTEHRQRDLNLLTGAPAPELSYSQVTSSVGVDLETALGDRCSGEFGLGIDQANYTDTADKPAYDRQQEPTWRAGVACGEVESMRFSASIGQKSRFPTMRELFGQALNRFLLNPDLRAEDIRTAEFGVEWQLESLQVGATVFAQEVDDAIGERRVGGLRQRINIEGSEIVGVELASRWQASDAWALGLNATVLNGRRLGFDAAIDRNLIERPERLALGYVEYTSAGGARGTLEVEHQGKAFSADADGDTAALPDSTQLHLHYLQPLTARLELGLHALNVTDELVLPQFGLPAAGRSLEGTLTFRW